MKKLYTFIMLIGLIVFGSTANAQCANDNVQFGTSTAPTVVGTPVTLTTCLFGGEYRLVTGLVAGSTYTFATCGDTDFDTQLTIFNNATGAVVGYNDDACGVQSSVTLVATGADLRVSLDQYSCSSNSSCMTLTATLVTGAGPVNPCNNITSIACGGTGNFSLSGTGSFTGNGPFSTPGAEKIYSFTATTSGAHSITVSHTGGGWVDLFFRTQASGCSGAGWTYVDDILGSATNSVTLVAGTTYYFMVDDEDATASTGTLNIACPSAVNPCNTISTIAGCGASGTFALTGAGVYNGIGTFPTPGAEKIFQFTTPVGLSGNYDIVVSHTGGFYVDLFFRTQASGCSGTGWTYVDDVLGSATNTIALAGGTTYYFMVDDEDLVGSNGTITINCPCIPTTTPDGSFVYDGPFTISGNTIDACSDCNLRPSDDQIYAVEILCEGSYTFQTCGGASWDTYLYLTTAFCGGTTIAFNDDACGLQSSVTATLTPGTYYIHVEGFSATSEGAFNLAVSGNLTPVQLAITGSTNVSCFGGSDGSATAQALTGTAPFNYEWNDPAAQTTATASGLSAGTYSVDGKDANGCEADAITVTISEPTLLEVSATSTDILCFGGSSDVTVVATGGTAPYSGDGTYSVTAGTYSYTVTDANGCTATVTISVTQPTLLEASASSTAIACFGGSSDVTVVASGGTAPYSGDGVYSVTAGTYTYTVTDANGCSVDVTITVTEPTLLEASASSTAIACFGGSSDVTVVATGGTAPYTGDGVYTVTAGTYDYTVTDANGCTADVSITVDQPTLLEASASATPILCNGGTSDVTVVGTGGTLPYTGDGVYTVTAGIYDYTVTDANGCTADVSIAIDEPSMLEVDLSGCGIVYDGAGIEYACATINSSVSGGTPGYSLNWSPTNESTGSITVCPDATTVYTLTATDANGCVTSDSWTVTVVDLSCTQGGGSGNSGSGSGSQEVAASSGTSYPSAPSCPSAGSDNSGSGNSGSGNGSSAGCSLPSESSASCSNASNGNGNSGNNGNNGNSGGNNASVLMCFNGTTYCVKLNQVENKLACGFTFGPCDMQQTAACDNTPAPTASPSCVCSGGIATLNVRYIGPSNQDLAINAKSCGVSLGTVTNAMTGQTFTVSAAAGGLSQLRNNTYFELVGSGFGQIEIPTNCCDNPIGQVFFPFEVIGWVDINGNSCGNNGNGGGGGGVDGMQTSIGSADKGSYLAENGAKMGQFPNPADQVSNFEFSVGELDNVTLTIVDINGHEIASIFTQEVEADRAYAVSFDVSELQSGIYYAVLTTSKGTLKNKFIVMK